MTPDGVLDVALIAVFAAVALIATVVVSHARLSDIRSKRDALLRSRGRSALMAVFSGECEAAEMSVLAELPTRLLVDLFHELNRNIRTGDLPSFRVIANDLGVVRWAVCLAGSRRWRRRLRGVQLLALLDEHRDLRLELLSDPHPRIRSTTATWTVEGANGAELDAVVRLLSDDDALTRFAATDALIRLGLRSVPAIVQQLAAGDRRGLMAALDVAEWINDSRFVVPALSLCRHHDPVIRSRAHGVLGSVGGTQAFEHLEAGLADDDERVRAAAAIALGRLRHWPSATRVASSLDDPSWEVRLAAGGALHNMGSPGLLVLRRAARSDAPLAADVAAQMLSRGRLLDERRGAA